MSYNSFSLKDVSRYYDVNTFYYRLLWHGKSLGIHHGFYDKDIKNQEDAILRVNETLSSIAEIKPGDKVLDAGCGVGGSSIWLAKNIGARVTGITISDIQIKKANRYATRAGVQVDFLKRDYADTKFPNETFDFIWGVESICHANDKAKVLKELYRILKPGGKIIISDWFRTKNKMSPQEEKTLNKFIHGFAVGSIETPEGFKKILEESGFKNVKKIDRGDDIKKNLEYGMSKANKLSIFAKLLPRVIPYFNEVARNYYGAVAEKEAYDKKLWTIQIVSADKLNDY